MSSNAAIVSQKIT